MRYHGSRCTKSTEAHGKAGEITQILRRRRDESEGSEVKRCDECRHWRLLPEDNRTDIDKDWRRGKCVVHTIKIDPWGAIFPYLPTYVLRTTHGKNWCNDFEKDNEDNWFLDFGEPDVTHDSRTPET
jgi:hypothetical protein